MKKILFLMKDKFYQEILSKKLSDRFNLDCSIIESTDDIDEGLLITDYVLGEDIWKLDFSSQDIKYQNINSINHMIEKAFIDREEANKKSKIITIINLKDSSPENSFVTELARQYSKDKKTLLINLNYFHSYKDELSDIGLDTLIFMDENQKSISTNKLFNLEYISSSKLPLEMEKSENYFKIIKILQSLKYDYIIFDINTQLSAKAVEYVNISNSVIYYTAFEQNQKYNQRVINFFDNNSPENEKIYIEKNEKGYKILQNNEENQTKNIKDMVKIL